MKNIFLLSFLIWPLLLQAQDFTELHDSSIAALRSKDIEQSIVLMEQAKTVAIETQDEQSFYRALDNLAFLYETNKEHEKSKSIYLELIDYLSTEGTDNYYAATLSNYAGLLMKMRNYEEAGEYLEKAIPLFTDIKGASAHDYIMSLFKMGVINDVREDFSSALLNYEEGLALLHELSTERGEMHLLFQERIAATADKLREYQRALDARVDQLQIYGELYNIGDLEYILIAGKAGDMALKLSKYQDALHYYKLAAELVKELDGKNLDHALLLLDQGKALAGLGRYSEAERMYKRSGEIRDSLGLHGTLNYAFYMQNIGHFYATTKQYDLAAKYFEGAKEIFEDQDTLNYENLSIVYNTLGAAYLQLDRLDEAEKLLKEAKKSCIEVYGELHPNMANILNNLAVLYRRLGQFEKTAALYEEMLALDEQTSGTESEKYAQGLFNVAQFYDQQYERDRALELIEQSEAIRKKILGERHPVYVSTLKSKAGLLTSLKQHGKAENLYRQVLQLTEAISGKESLEYGSVLNSLAVLYYYQKNYQLAEDHFLQSLDIKKKLMEADNPAYIANVRNLAMLYNKTSNFAEAKKYFRQANKYYFSQINKKFNFLSEEEKAAFIATMENAMSEFAEFATKAVAEDPALAGDVMDNYLILKNLLLRSSSNVREAILTGNDQEAKDLFINYIQVKQQLNNQYLTGNKDDAETALLEVKAHELERELVSKAKLQTGEQKIQTWKDVQQSLKIGEAAIEVISFPAVEDDELVKKYFAVIIAKDFPQPKLQFLFNEVSVAEHIKKGQDGSMIRFINDLYMDSTLYKIVWQPLEPHLKGVNTVYYSPTGILHKISVAAIQDPQQQSLLQKYSFHTLSGTGLIAESAQELSINNANIALFGGALFDVDTAQVEEYLLTLNNTSTEAPVVSLPESESRGTTWSYLPGTLSEVKGIEQLLSSKEIKTTTFTGIEALEENLKSNCNNAAVLHIATHGFFFADIENDIKDHMEAATFSSHQNPLLRSGLVLTGGNSTWKGNKAIGKEDGILTAYEVANLDLSNTNLVVLSACETGLGDIQGNEGVYGLQRSFKMAGAENLIMSLWQVPDKETAEFMGRFYNHWSNGSTLHEAFKQTQLDMSRRHNPYYWAAFVLIR